MTMVMIDISVSLYLNVGVAVMMFRMTEMCSLQHYFLISQYHSFRPSQLFHCLILMLICSFYFTTLLDRSSGQTP